MERSIKINKKSQFEKLVQLMENNPAIACGKPPFGTTQNHVRELWEGFAVELNSLGPPSRTSREWQRVWIHYKAKLKKKKLANNKQNLRTTGGGPSEEVFLNSLEECVAQLVHIREQIVPCGESCGLENTPRLPEDNPTHIAESGALIIAEPLGTAREAFETTTATPRRRINRNTSQEEPLEILRKQTETQTEVLTTLKKIEETAYKNYKLNKQLVQIKKRKLALLERKLNVDKRK